MQAGLDAGSLARLRGGAGGAAGGGAAACRRCRRHAAVGADRVACVTFVLCITLQGRWQAGRGPPGRGGAAEQTGAAGLCGGCGALQTVDSNSQGQLAARRARSQAVPPVHWQCAGRAGVNGPARRAPAIIGRHQLICATHRRPGGPGQRGRRPKAPKSSLRRPWDGPAGLQARQITADSSQRPKGSGFGAGDYAAPRLQAAPPAAGGCGEQGRGGRCGAQGRARGPPGR